MTIVSAFTFLPEASESPIPRRIINQREKISTELARTMRGLEVSGDKKNPRLLGTGLEGGADNSTHADLGQHRFRNGHRAYDPNDQWRDKIGFAPNVRKRFCRRNEDADESFEKGFRRLRILSGSCHAGGTHGLSSSGPNWIREPVPSDFGRGWMEKIAVNSV